MKVKLSLKKEKQTATNLFWDLSNNNPYEDSQLLNIIDNMGDREIPVTSIPSPFAQMHLFDTAFKTINEEITSSIGESGNIQDIFERKSTYHNLISYCLDVWEILFEYEYLKANGFRFVKMNYKNEKREISRVNKIGLNTFSNAIELFINNYNGDGRFTFINNDLATQNNTEEILTVFSDITFVFYDNSLIAGTSPYTGFFSSPNIMDSNNLKRLDGTRFFSDPIPLSKRNKDFIEFIFRFIVTDKKISDAFCNLYSYCKHTLDALPSSNLKSKLTSIIEKHENSDIANLYDKLSHDSIDIMILPKIPYRIKRKENIGVRIANTSDYRIRTSKTGIINPPLALINKGNKQNYLYVDGPLPSNFEIDPALLGPEIENRYLPTTQQINYPFLTIDDVLTKSIIKLDYHINNDKYWVPSNQNNFKYLLPITENYFKYFSIDDLKNNLSLNTNSATDSIEIKLRIPVMGEKSNGYIEFKRTYSDRSNEYSLSEINKGNIKHANIFLGIYPFYKVDNNDFNDIYKFFIYHDADIIKNAWIEPFKIYNGNNINKIPVRDFIRTRKEDNQSYVTHYFEVNRYLSLNEDDITFDVIKIYLELQNGQIVENIIIPELIKIDLVNNNTESIVALDFGTSNTHIAYLVGAETTNIKSYKTLNDDKQELVLLNKPLNGELDIPLASGLLPAQLNEFVPVIISDRSLFRFPIKTLINVSNHVNPQLEDNLEIFSNINIPFAVSNIPNRHNIDKIYSDLKWGIIQPDREDLRNLVESFIKELMLLARNLLLSNNANPLNTKVIWFKPLSMTDKQESILRKYWELYYKIFFKKNTLSNGNIYCITESWAPIYAQDLNFGNGKVYLNLDIGGGSTDIVAIDDDHNIILTSSFRFAGNVLYENGLFNAQTRNGFVEHYITIMKKYFNVNNKNSENDILDSMIDNNQLKSEDIISFFFTFSYFRNQLELDKRFKLLLLLHITSLFYHVAQLMKVSNCEMPLYIGLSGNGAKLFEIINGSKDLNKINGIASVVSKIFNKIYNNNNTIELLIRENPKESTCNGGIKGIDIIASKKDMDIQKYVIAMGDNKTICNNQLRDNDRFRIKEENYNDIVNDVMSNFKDYILFFMNDLWKECNFESNYGLDFISNKSKILNYMLEESKIKGVLNQILKNKKLEMLDETLFYYPLKAYLYDLSIKLYRGDINL